MINKNLTLSNFRFNVRTDKLIFHAEVCQILGSISYINARCFSLPSSLERRSLSLLIVVQRRAIPRAIYCVVAVSLRDSGLYMELMGLMRYPLDTGFAWMHREKHHLSAGIIS